MRQPAAIPMRSARSTTSRFSTGSAPGSPRQTGHTWLFAVSPNRVEQPQNALLEVRSCA